MGRINSPVISIAQTLNINSNSNQLVKGMDLNFNGYNILDKNSIPFELSDKNANINRALFWLSSKKGDYGRRDLDKGGILYDLLGKLCKNTNLSEWEEIIKTNFNLEFSRDLELIQIKLITDTTYKKLIINMIVRDLLTNQVFGISEGAEL